jgi:hypothetical protein
MSQHHGYSHPPAEEDRIASGAIIAVGVGSLLVFFVGSLLAGVYLHHRRAQIWPDGQAAVAAEAGKPKIGMVEQRLFDNANQGVAMKARQQQKLERSGWVDRDRGIVFMPIDRAMDLVVRGERALAPPPPPEGRL